MQLGDFNGAGIQPFVFPSRVLCSLLKKIDSEVTKGGEKEAKNQHKNWLQSTGRKRITV